MVREAFSVDEPGAGEFRPGIGGFSSFGGVPASEASSRQ